MTNSLEIYMPHLKRFLFFRGHAEIAFILLFPKNYLWQKLYFIVDISLVWIRFMLTQLKIFMLKCQFRAKHDHVINWKNVKVLNSEPHENRHRTAKSF